MSVIVLYYSLYFIVLHARCRYTDVLIQDFNCFFKYLGYISHNGTKFISKDQSTVTF